MVLFKKGTPSVAWQFLCLIIVMTAGHGIVAYTPISKETVFADVLLTELLSRMDKEYDPLSNYFDMDADMPKGLDMVSRSSMQNVPEDYEYRNVFPGVQNPSIRDQKFLQDSSLWGHQFLTGKIAEPTTNHFPKLIKADASLPAYCNPPNPCPFGYEEEEGCLTNFENTALFSREYQAAQDCTCDSEHMFDCAGQDNSSANSEMDSTMQKFLMHQFQNDNGIDNSRTPAKKLYGLSAAPAPANPFLEGDKLPIAAKKGNHVKA